MLMKRSLVSVLLLVGLLGSVERAVADYHSWTGGGCYVYRNGLLTWPDSEYHYYFNPLTGQVQFFADGGWRVQYYNGPAWADSPGVYCNMTPTTSFPWN